MNNGEYARREDSLCCLMVGYYLMVSCLGGFLPFQRYHCVLRYLSHYVVDQHKGFKWNTLLESDHEPLFCQLQ